MITYTSLAHPPGVVSVVALLSHRYGLDSQHPKGEASLIPDLDAFDWPPAPWSLPRDPR